MAPPRKPTIDPIEQARLEKARLRQRKSRNPILKAKRIKSERNRADYQKRKDRKKQLETTLSSTSRLLSISETHQDQGHNKLMKNIFGLFTPKSPAKAVEKMNSNFCGPDVTSEHFQHYHSPFSQVSDKENSHRDGSHVLPSSSTSKHVQRFHSPFSKVDDKENSHRDGAHMLPSSSIYEHVQRFPSPFSQVDDKENMHRDGTLASPPFDSQQLLLQDDANERLSLKFALAKLQMENQQELNKKRNSINEARWEKEERLAKEKESKTIAAANEAEVELRKIAQEQAAQMHEQVAQMSVLSFSTKKAKLLLDASTAKKSRASFLMRQVSSLATTQRKLDLQLSTPDNGERPNDHLPSSKYESSKIALSSAEGDDDMLPLETDAFSPTIACCNGGTSIPLLPESLGSVRLPSSGDVDNMDRGSDDVQDDEYILYNIKKPSYGPLKIVRSKDRDTYFIQYKDCPDQKPKTAKKILVKPLVASRNE